MLAHRLRQLQTLSTSDFRLERSGYLQFLAEAIRVKMNQLDFDNLGAYFSTLLLPFSTYISSLDKLPALRTFMRAGYRGSLL